MDWKTYPITAALDEVMQGKNLKTCYSHAVAVGKTNALCGVKGSSLSLNDISTASDDLPTCPKCRRIIEKSCARN